MQERFAQARALGYLWISTLGYIDLHSHVLPALDDGAPDFDTSLAMLRGLNAIGFERVCATPHQREGMFLPTRAEIDAAHAAVHAQLTTDQVPLALSLAAENMWDSTFYQRARTGDIPCYDGGPAFLVELPVQQLPMGLIDQMFEFRVQGKLPVLAHPERYQPLWKDRDTLLELAGQCALVIDLGALAGYHGRAHAKVARRLVKDRLAHAAASDAHTLQDVRSAAEGIRWISKKMGADAVTRLLVDNPRRILQGELPEP